MELLIHSIIHIKLVTACLKSIKNLSSSKKKVNLKFGYILIHDILVVIFVVYDV